MGLLLASRPGSAATKIHRISDASGYKSPNSKPAKSQLL